MLLFSFLWPVSKFQSSFKQHGTLIASFAMGDSNVFVGSFPSLIAENIQDGAIQLDSSVQSLEQSMWDPGPQGRKTCKRGKISKIGDSYFSKFRCSCFLIIATHGAHVCKQYVFINVLISVFSWFRVQWVYFSCVWIAVVILSNYLVLEYNSSNIWQSASNPSHK